jgi:hypothetical protein
MSAAALSWPGWEPNMKRDQGRPPSWFVLAVLIGAITIGAALAVVIASTMQ